MIRLRFHFEAGLGYQWFYINGVVHKWGYRQLDGLQWNIPLKWMSEGYPYFRKLPNGFKVPIVFTSPLMTASKQVNFACHGQVCWIGFTESLVDGNYQSISDSYANNEWLFPTKSHDCQLLWIFQNEKLSRMTLLWVNFLSVLLDIHWSAKRNRILQWVFSPRHHKVVPRQL